MHENPADRLFVCDHFARQLAQRHCRRRQLERKQAQDPRSKKPIAGEAVYPHCAEACEKGREVAAALAEAGVASRTCGVCGSALVGAEADGPCPECEEARREKSGAPARGYLPAAAPLASDRLWTPGAVPDVPIAALTKTNPTPTAAPVTTEAPAQRAQEQTMETERHCPTKGCGKKLRSNNTKGICGDCQARGVKPPAAAPAAAAPLVVDRKAVFRPEKGVTTPAPKVDLERLTNDELLELAERVDLEVKTRLAEIDRQREAMLARMAKRADAAAREAA